MQPFSVSLVMPHFYPATVYGGPIFSSLYTYREIARLGNSVYVSTTSANRERDLKVEPEKWTELQNGLYVKYYNQTIRDRFSWPLVIGLKKDIKSSDIVHIQYLFDYTTPAGLFIAGLSDKPVLLSPRGSLSEWILAQGVKLKKQWLKFLIRPFASKVWWHATSQQEKEEILSHFPNAKIEIIPNGIFLEEYRNIKDLDRGALLEKFTGKSRKVGRVISSMGRIHKKKGFDVLIRSFKQVYDAGENIYLIIAGQDEGEKQNLTQLVSELELTDRVFFTGQLNDEDKRILLKNSDVFALPSHNENFGNVYAEALACGTPIVASKMTPWKEVEEAGCGRWVENSPDKTARAIMELISADRNSIKVKCHHFIQGFDWSEIGKRFEGLFYKMNEEYASKS